MKPEIERNRVPPGPTGPGRHEVSKGVIEIIAEQMGMDPAKIEESDLLQDEIGCDSLDIVEISMELEEHFEISIPDELAEDLKTISDVIDGVQRQVGNVTD